MKAVVGSLLVKLTHTAPLIGFGNSISLTCALNCCFYQSFFTPSISNLVTPPALEEVGRSCHLLLILCTDFPHCRGLAGKQLTNKAVLANLMG